VSPLNVVILAAGQGKRMYSNLPKVLHSLAGKPLLGHVIDTAQVLAAQKVCVVFGHGGTAVPNAFPDRVAIWVKQEPQLGTGHAVMQALPHMDAESIALVLYGDVPLTRVDTLSRLTAIAQTGKVAVLTLRLDDPTGYGRIVRNRTGKVVGIVEHKDANAEQRAIQEVNTGIVALPTRHLAAWLSKLKSDNAQGEYYLTDIIAIAVADGVEVDTAQPAQSWETLGVNSKTQLAELERVYQREQAASLLERGVTLADPARFDLRGELRCGRDVSIDVNCVFEGKVALADSVTVGAGSILKNVTVAEKTQIAPYSVIEDTIIGADCRVGPYARIRPGTKLADGAHVGNFVEIKNSEIGVGSKANHLAYVGDATVGKNVNIGAGTITCNYDGANKHRTIIEDDVFIGSDTQLVAPVTVGKGATLGAGTTLTQDAPAGELTLVRARQVTIKEWQRPTKPAKRDK
jgi:bifunctional UDP-N-acetylglucosamine pyrophosphorylase / glucosamine-1-phosphate N-acetyltransferase